MAEHFIFYVGESNDGDPRVRGFLDFEAEQIIIYDDGNGAELFRIPVSTPTNIYVPYMGAISDVDLNSKNLNTAGTIEASSIIMSSPDGHRWKFTVGDDGMLTQPGEDLGL